MSGTVAINDSSNCCDDVFSKGIPSTRVNRLIEKGPECEDVDRVQIGDGTKYLSRSGLDIKKSAVKHHESRFDFNLEFETSSFEKLCANGYFAEEQKELRLELNFLFNQEMIIDGQVQSRTFEFRLSLHARDIKSISISPFEKKEDIIQLVRRLIGDLVRVVQDEDKKLGGVLFDFEDYRDIAGIDNGRFVKKLEALIQMIIIHTQTVERMKEKEEGELVFLRPERERISGIEIEKREMVIMNFHVEIRDVTERTRFSKEEIGHQGESKKLNPRITELISKKDLDI